MVWRRRHAAGPDMVEAHGFNVERATMAQARQEDGTSLRARRRVVASGGDGRDDDDDESYNNSGDGKSRLTGKMLVLILCM